MGKLRAACIVDSTLEPHVLRRLLRQSKASEAYSIELVICLNTTSSADAPEPATELSKHIRSARERIRTSMMYWLKRVETLIVRHNSDYAGLNLQNEASAPAVATLNVTPVLFGQGGWRSFNASDLQKIEQSRLDILINLTSSALDASAYNACPKGMLAVRYGNNGVVRSACPGFWEVANREDATQFTILHSSGDADEMKVLFAGAIATSPYYMLNLLRLQLKACAFLQLALEKIAKHGVPQSAPSISHAVGGHGERPTIPQQLKYASGLLGRVLSRILEKTKGTSRRWNVAFQSDSDWRTTSLENASAIENPSGHYLADPFMIVEGGRHICFLEDFDCSSERGRIVAYEVTAHGATKLGTALTGDLHLSFPFVFRAAGDIFMCPDTHQAREIRLYKCTNFPLEWELHQTLMTEVNAVDTCIFPHSGRWWMLTNIDSADINDHCSELHLFSAEAHDAAHWEPHPSNPIIFDPATARNGGLIIESGEIFRVHQQQSFAKYGTAVGVAQITELSAHAYEERLVRELRPTFFDNIDGIHTLSCDGDVIAVDFAGR